MRRRILFHLGKCVGEIQELLPVVRCQVAGAAADVVPDLANSRVINRQPPRRGHALFTREAIAGRAPPCG
jgi:hypothetical protein